MCAGPRSFTTAGDAWQRRESGGRQRGDSEVATVPVDKSMAGIARVPRLGDLTYYHNTHFKLV
jgi:hypothetical protein